ncbi:hypothetical protein [Allofranklinella schreckenbergeri]|uniref:hypothetical protein n=1 Tax=Allofranklinella schreckenbergeri TaxID=1076744 RepID=UPI0011C48FE9|nr:hypothetical protein [Allofranklinella schreckenbergeri]
MMRACIAPLAVVGMREVGEEKGQIVTENTAETTAKNTTPKTRHTFPIEKARFVTKTGFFIITHQKK